jgi:hypothetical protein
MAKNSFDQFSKQLLEEVLAPFGMVETSYEVSGEPQLVDVYFVPTVQPSELGLLGRMAQTPCLIEPFRNQPTTDEIRSCLLKLFQVHGDFRRQARRAETSVVDAQLPFLWILASSASDGLLQQFEAATQEEWPSGVYFLPLALKAAVISINQLPRTDETLWLRLLGKGQTQQGAIEEVLAFDTRDPRRSSILRLLANWKISIEVTRQVEAQEEDLLMALSQAYLEWEHETEQRGRQEGRQEGELAIVLRLLTRRVGTIAPETEAQIRHLSPNQLEELGEALLDFTQLSDLNDWFQAHR